MFIKFLIKHNHLISYFLIGLLYLLLLICIIIIDAINYKKINTHIIVRIK